MKTSTAKEEIYDALQRIITPHNNKRINITKEENAMGCLYWVFIGWWLNPILFLLKLIFKLPAEIIKIIIFAVIWVALISVMGAWALIIGVVGITVAIVKTVLKRNKMHEEENKESIQSVKGIKSKERIYVGYKDDLFWEAGEFVIEKNKASVGTIQMYFGIGFNRAEKIMEELYEAGVVGEEEGTRPRKVLMSHDEFEELRKNSTIDIENNFQKYDQEAYISNRIEMYNNKIDYMTGEDFELYVAQILGRIGFYNIQTTKGSGDQGVDIIAEKDSIKHAFQCKRYDKPVGNKAVQEVFAGKFYYHCHVAVVVTNNYFTQSAKELAHENGVVLWDRDILNKYISCNSEKKIKNNEEEKEKTDENDLRNTCMIMHSIILETCKNIGVSVGYADFKFEDGNAIFGVFPHQGTRLRDVMNCEKALSLNLGTDIKIKMFPERGYIGIIMPIMQFEKRMEEMLKEDRFSECYKICKEEKTNEAIKDANTSDSIVEKYYYINGDFTKFSLKKENKIEVLAICENNINAANLYLSYSVKLKEEWSGKIDFAIAINFKNAVAIYTNENGVEFFGGEEIDGEIVAGIPKWMDKARNELLNGNEEEFLRMVEEANGYLDEFMKETIKYIE